MSAIRPVVTSSKGSRRSRFHGIGEKKKSNTLKLRLLRAVSDLQDLDSHSTIMCSLLNDVTEISSNNPKKNTILCREALPSVSMSMDTEKKNPEKQTSAMEELQKRLQCDVSSLSSIDFRSQSTLVNVENNFRRCLTVGPNIVQHRWMFHMMLDPRVTAIPIMTKQMFNSLLSSCFVKARACSRARFDSKYNLQKAQPACCEAIRMCRLLSHSQDFTCPRIDTIGFSSRYSGLCIICVLKEVNLAVVEYWLRGMLPPLDLFPFRFSIYSRAEFDLRDTIMPDISYESRVPFLAHEVSDYTIEGQQQQTARFIYTPQSRKAQ